MPDYRAALHELMTATIADEIAHQLWTYEAIRPCNVPGSWSPGQHVVGDCSKGVQFLNKWAGCKDPMGENYGPYGNSSTLWAHLQHLDTVTELKVGDIITFGYSGNEHAAMVQETGSDPLLWSFGHQGAPNNYRLSYDRRARQFLRNPLPIFIPTPQDKLRMKTGFFSWVAWRLGEGDWRPYGKKAKIVRPDVPLRIPAGWWVRYAQFIKNRKNGDPPTT